MDAQEAMSLGMAIAKKHQGHVLQFINDMGSTPEQALHGNLVWLGAEIMKAITDACEQEYQASR